MKAVAIDNYFVGMEVKCIKDGVEYLGTISYDYVSDVTSRLPLKLLIRLIILILKRVLIFLMRFL